MDDYAFNATFDSLTSVPYDISSPNSIPGNQDLGKYPSDEEIKEEKFEMEKQMVI
ncbi:MAG: hypothetical protein EZS28_044378, partial [Streblomastix strix]